MNQAILVEGKEYISAIRASEKSDYTSDYIGQLCRAKKIPGKLIGKTWYINFRALLEYKNKRKPRGGIERNHESIHTAEIRKMVLPGHLSYESERLSPLPPLSKMSRHIKSPLKFSFIIESAVFSLVLIAALSFGFIYLQNISPSLAIKIEKNTAILSHSSLEFIALDQAKVSSISLLGGVIQGGDLLVDNWMSLKFFTLNKFVGALR